MEIGVSDIILGYGAEGLSQSEGLKGLLEAQKQIHRHLLVNKSDHIIQFQKFRRN